MYTGIDIDINIDIAIDVYIYINWNTSGSRFYPTMPTYSPGFTIAFQAFLL